MYISIFVNKYCRSGNICEVCIFANFMRMANSRISLKLLFQYSATEEKEKLANSKLREKSQNQKFVKNYNRENYQYHSINFTLQTMH